MARDDVTRILASAGVGGEAAVASLLPLVYDELRALAGGFFQAQAPDHTLQPTALVHEAYLKLVGSGKSDLGGPSPLLRGGGEGHAADPLEQPSSV